MRGVGGKLSYAVAGFVLMAFGGLALMFWAPSQWVANMYMGGFIGVVAVGLIGFGFLMFIASFRMR